MEEKDFSRYLIDEYPIMFQPSLAVALGINEAILLQKIHLWLNRYSAIFFIFFIFFIFTY